MIIASCIVIFVLIFCSFIFYASLRCLLLFRPHCSFARNAQALITHKHTDLDDNHHLRLLFRSADGRQYTHDHFIPIPLKTEEYYQARQVGETVRIRYDMRKPSRLYIEDIATEERANARVMFVHSSFMEGLALLMAAIGVKEWATKYPLYFHGSLP